MAIVTKKESGFVFQDDFSKGISTEWELIPNNYSRAVYSGNKLNLRHGSSTVYLFLKRLQSLKEFVLDLKNEYNPTTDKDVGGITAFNTTKDFIALEEYFDVATGTTESYPWLRLVKDNLYYSAYWSDDGIEWYYIGTNNLNAKNPKVGMFLEHNTGSQLGIELVRVQKSNSVTVDNLQAGTVVSLVDKDDNIVSSLTCTDFDNKVIFDVSNLPQPIEARFVVDTGLQVLDHGYEMEIYGGDHYTFEVTPEITFVKDGEEYLLESHIEEFLGYTSQEEEYKDVEIFVRNKMPGVFTSITITLEESGGTDHYKRLVLLSKDLETPVWGSTVSVPKLEAGKEAKLLGRLKRESNPLLFTPTIYFSLKVTANYTV